MKVSLVATLLAAALFSFFINFALSQDGTTKLYTPAANINLDNMLQPRMKKDWNNPGAYEVVAYLSRSTVFKNDTTTLSAYVTGYGLIGNCKIFLIPSNPIFSEESLMHTGLNPVDTVGDFISLEYGRHAFNLPKDNTVISTFGGPKSHHWDYASIFVDYDMSDSSSFALLSEKTSVRPPFKFDLKTKGDIEPGDYTINLYMTYFNGAEWKISKIALPLHVNNYFEEWPWIAYILSAIGIGVAFTAFIYQIKSYYRDGKRKNKTPKQKEIDNPQITKPDHLPKKSKQTPEQKEKAKNQRREYVSKWVWKIKNIFLSERTVKSPL
ncbi:hypothetical protein [Agriterribacter sp.]|uniref:hypothetical protein n=1 Tax=Agriterribacter sp. TaxID=2821509 RepID=UPI002C2C1EA8|nr:hypothetical protein [Agriterribacter sp.]HTN08847.1 hypothetical protein [Agriterribacter sp.]